MVSVVSFSKDIIRKYDKCECCNNRVNIVEVNRNGIGIAEFFDNEKKKYAV